MSDHAQLAVALPWFAKGQTRREQLRAREPNAAMAQLFLRNISASRATTHERLQRFVEADADWLKAINLSPAHQQAMVKTAKAKWKAQRTASVGNSP